MGNGFVQIQPIEREPGVLAAPVASPTVFEGESMICGLDVGSTTCKYVLATPRGEVVAHGAGAAMDADNVRAHLAV